MFTLAEYYSVSNFEQNLVGGGVVIDVDDGDDDVGVH
jgi:hypothetical protein